MFSFLFKKKALANLKTHKAYPEISETFLVRFYDGEGKVVFEKQGENLKDAKRIVKKKAKSLLRG